MRNYDPWPSTRGSVPPPERFRQARRMSPPSVRQCHMGAPADGPAAAENHPRCVRITSSSSISERTTGSTARGSMQPDGRCLATLSSTTVREEFVIRRVLRHKIAWRPGA